MPTFKDIKDNDMTGWIRNYPLKSPKTPSNTNSKYFFAKNGFPVEEALILLFRGGVYSFHARPGSYGHKTLATSPRRDGARWVFTDQADIACTSSAKHFGVHLTKNLLRGEGNPHLVRTFLHMGGGGVLSLCMAVVVRA